MFKSKLGILISFICLSFFVFVIWIIHEANIGRDNALFVLVRATPYGDKIGHLVLATILTFTVNFAFRFKYRSWKRIPLYYGSFLVLVLVITEEGSQYFMPTRSFDIWDATANFGGILVASIAIHQIAKARKRSIPKNKED